jgi:hypothetical protein
VLIESDLESFTAQIDELGAADARNFVLQSVVKAGIQGTPGISRMVEGAHPVNSKDETIDGDLKDNNGDPLPATHPRMQPAKYRARYEVTARQ